MRRLWFWTRWTWRDLRARWVQVAACALIIGLGTGLYSGLASTSAWRRDSYDASYRVTHMYDLRMTLATGSFVPVDSLQRTILGIAGHDELAAVATRLVGSTQLDASTSTTQILVPATVVGIDVSQQHGAVDDLAIMAGRNLRPSDAGRSVGVIGRAFANYYHLPASGSAELSGQRHIRLVGQGVMPEDFVIFSAQHYEQTANAYGTIYTTLATAGDLLGHPGQANDVSLRLRPGSDPAGIRRQIDTALSSAFPGVGATWVTRAQDPARKQLYSGLSGTQRLYDIFAALVLAGAVFGAFNLTVRIVESQRREIGVAMALGTPPEQIAARPALVGLEVACLGAGLGVLLGIWINQLFIAAIRGYTPLPMWVTRFQTGTFVRGALIGVVLTMLAVLLPVIRAVRVAPIDAIRTTAISASGVGLSPLLARLPLPGSSLVQLPFRNVLRSPRRTLLTALGIGAAVTVLVCMLGLSDSFFATIDSARREVVAGPRGRTIVSLDTFRLTTDPVVEGIRHSSAVDRSEAELQLPGSLARHGTSFDVLITALDLHGGLWRPTLISGSYSTSRSGLVISEKAAHDLGVGPGGTVTLHHPQRTGLTTYRFVDSPMTVLGVTALPTRFLAYIDISRIGAMNLSGVTNSVVVTPKAGTSTNAMQRALFVLPGVGFVQSPVATIDAARKQINEVLAILRVADGAMLAMVVLIAFNATSINLDERRREEATMFAFGVPIRTVVGVAVTESLVSGVVGTLIGIGAGRLVLTWITTSMMPGIIEDIAIRDVLGGTTVLVAIALGVAAVAVAPLFSAHRLSRMDIPSTLRVME